jgi:hypothetical protein
MDTISVLFENIRNDDADSIIGFLDDSDRFTVGTIKMCFSYAVNNCKINATRAFYEYCPGFGPRNAVYSLCRTARELYVDEKPKARDKKIVAIVEMLKYLKSISYQESNMEEARAQVFNLKTIYPEMWSVVTEF